MKKTKRLALDRTTLVKLTTGDLQRAGGGGYYTRWCGNSEVCGPTDGCGPTADCTALCTDAC